MKFPNDFYELDHPLGGGAKHWIPIGQEMPNHNPSIIGGGMFSFMGSDGITRFEMQLNNNIYVSITIEKINELLVEWIVESYEEENQILKDRLRAIDDKKVGFNEDYLNNVIRSYRGVNE